MAFVNKLNDAVRIVQDLEYEYESVIDAKNEEIKNLEQEIERLQEMNEVLSNKNYELKNQNK